MSKPVRRAKAVLSLRALSLSAPSLSAPLLAAMLTAAGCGGGGGPAEPNGLRMTLGAGRVQITREVPVEAVTLYSRRDAPDCDWYVNGVLGGDSTVGTVTQTNPGIYTAPDAVPTGGRVVVSAVSRTDSGHTDSDTLDVVFTIRYVDAMNGTDDAGGGAWTSPLRTLTYALDLCSDGDTLFAMPGEYDPDHGESGSFFVPAGVTLVGEDRTTCAVSGSGSDLCVVRLGDGATLDGFTIRNREDDQMALLSTGGGLVRNVAVEGPFGYTAMRADGGRGDRANDVVIEDCHLINSASPHTGRALEVYYGSHCTVRGCEISGWQEGIYANRDSDPLVEETFITDNVFGVIAAGGGGLLTEPDLGGGARGSAGGNTISGNTLVGLSNQTTATLWAIGNTWTNDPPLTGPPYPADLQNTAGGAIIWTR